jgi:hypothetical protein
MNPRSEKAPTDRPGYERGTRLYCRTCKSEIEVISPCTCDPPDQVLRCCGADMLPTTGVAVNLDDN